MEECNQLGCKLLAPEFLASGFNHGHTILCEKYFIFWLLYCFMYGTSMFFLLLNFNIIWLILILSIILTDINSTYMETPWKKYILQILWSPSKFKSTEITTTKKLLRLVGSNINCWVSCNCVLFYEGAFSLNRWVSLEIQVNGAPGGRRLPTCGECFSASFFSDWLVLKFESGFDLRGLRTP